MTTQLHQILAVSQGVKTRTNEAVTKAYHAIQQATRLAGISRTYRPLDDDGERFPAESTRVQVNTRTAIAQIQEAMAKLLDVELVKDIGNTQAKADLIVEGQTLATDVPVTYLLFLEKQLRDLATIVAKLPVLDPAEKWAYDPATDTYATAPVETSKTKKVPRAFTLAPATDKHPAQVQAYQEDVLVGYWTTVKYSGALPQAAVTELRGRVAVLQDAVKQARERANQTEVEQREVGATLLSYVFGVLD